MSHTIPDDLLDALKDYFEQREDVRDGSYGEQVANEEMHLLIRLGEECRPSPTPEHGEEWVKVAHALGETPEGIILRALINVASISPLSTASPQEIAKTALVAAGVLKRYGENEPSSTATNHEG